MPFIGPHGQVLHSIIPWVTESFILLFLSLCVTFTFPSLAYSPPPPLIPPSPCLTSPAALILMISLVPVKSHVRLTLTELPSLLYKAWPFLEATPNKINKEDPDNT